MENKISVLMSVYHKEQPEYLDAALRSVFDQTVPPAQVVLVKDGPLTAELDRVIERFEREYPQMTVVPLAKNVGLGNALNEGLNHCKYDLVARMDTDDICLEDRFEKQLKAFEADPSLSVVGGWIDEFESDPDVVVSCRRPPESHRELRTFFQGKNPLNHMTVMFRKEAVKNVGNYQHFYLLEDYWLWGRLMANGAKFYNVPSCLVKVRGGASMTARRGGWKYFKSEMRLQEEFLKMGLINRKIFARNLSVRFAVRMMPNRVRKFVYSKLLRK